jgi:protein TonB
MIVGLAVLAIYGLAISQADYPPEALRLRQEGSVKVAVEVGVDGQIERCIVTQSSGFPALDDGTCELVVRRFKMKPSTGANDRVRNFPLIKWELSDDSSPPSNFIVPGVDGGPKVDN